MHRALVVPWNWVVTLNSTSLPPFSRLRLASCSDVSLRVFFHLLLSPRSESLDVFSVSSVFLGLSLDFRLQKLFLDFNRFLLLFIGASKPAKPTRGVFFWRFLHCCLFS